MQIATWNINSVRTRLENLLRYLREVSPDVVCLQEIKCTDEQFPRLEVEAEGYNVATHGQKAWNGVAILSKRPMEVEVGLAGDAADVQSRYIEALVATDAMPVRVCCLYLPNGNPPGTEKYAYKLAWMDRLIARARALLAYEEPLVMAGDYNVIPARAMSGIPTPGSVTRSICRRAGRASAPCRTSASPTRCGRRRMPPGSTPSGIIRPAPGSGTRASASTICCFRRRRPTVSSG